MSKFGSYLKTRQFRINAVLAFFTVVVIVLIAFFSLGAYTRHGSGIPVPKLKGLSVDRAMSILKDQGFDYKIDSAYVADIAPGTIIEQDPDPGTNVKEGRTIYLTMITTNAPIVAMPDLTQSTFIEASATISNFGLKVGDTTYRADIARDHVLEAKLNGVPIAAGTKVPKGSKIDLVLGDGRGANEVDIPDLTNQELDGAKFAIKGAGLTIGTITYQGEITDSTSLIVIGQSPARTDSLSKTSLGSRINLTVSQGKKNNDQQQPQQTN
jgi:beta-lactam-binding protein with PASTA domain